MKKSLTTIAILLIISTLAFMQSVQKPKEMPQNVKVEIVSANNTHDLVCKMKLSNSNTTTAIHDKKQYRFCSESCKKQFVKNPEKYIEK